MIDEEYVKKLKIYIKKLEEHNKALESKLSKLNITETEAKCIQEMKDSFMKWSMSFKRK